MDFEVPFDIEKHRTLLENCYQLYSECWPIYQKMYNYYCGATDINHHMITFNSKNDSDVDDSFSDINNRIHGKVSVNNIKKFIKEETSYSLGNDITYISHKGDEDIINTAAYNMAHWDAAHDTNLMKGMLLYSKNFELYYINKDAEFCAKIISPRHGFAYTDDYDNILLFFHIFRKAFDTSGTRYIDIYTPNEIIHCDQTFHELQGQPRENNILGVIPVGIAKLSDEDWRDTIYNDIKNLQDAYERNLSDISQEITELRDAYLWLNNIQLPKRADGSIDTAAIKKCGIIETKGNSKEISAQWLIKNINDGFIKDTLQTLEDQMYKISFHINTNERLPSNTSSLTLRAKMLSLEEKCKLNDKALSNCIKTRMKMLFLYLNWKNGTNYDYKDIKIKFTPNIPMDDLMTAQIISQLGNKLSTETGLAQLSFVENPKEEMAKIHAEEEADPAAQGANLLNGGGADDNNPPAEGTGTGE